MINKLQSRSGRVLTVCGVLILSAALHLFFVFYFGDVDFEADSYLHFIYTVSTFADLPKSLNYAAGVWPKPLFTLLTGLLVWISGVRQLWLIKILNTFIWLISGGLIYRLARQLNLSFRARILAVGLTEFSFLGFRAAVGSLTEPFFTLLVLAALINLYDRRYTLSCLFLSLSALARPEGLILIPAWAIILWIMLKRRSFLDLLVLVGGPLLWNFWGYLLTHDPTFILTNGYPLDIAPYGHGGWFDYFIGLFQYEPIIFPLFILGFVITVKERKTELFPFHLLLSFYFGFNVLAWRFGLFGTAGLLRYFVAIIPWLALFAALTLDRTKLLVAKLGVGVSVFLPALQIFFTILVLNSHTAGYHLYNTPTIHHGLVEAGHWIRENRPNDYVYASHPALLYYAGRNFYSGTIALNSSALHKPGIVAYESGFGSPNLRNYLHFFDILGNFGDYVYIYDFKHCTQSPKEIVFGTDSVEPYLGDGWSIAEGWGRWSEGGQSEIALCWNSPKNLTISVAAIPHFVYGKQQSVMIYYNDNLVETYLFPENVDGIQQISFRVPATLVSGRLDVIRFVYGYAISPMELGVNDDRRLLAVGFLNMHISAEP